MNAAAERYLTRAKNYLAKGDEFYRKAKPEIEAAIAAGASQREVARFLAKSHAWVQDVIRWDGEGTLYGKDTARRQRDMARQYITEAPLEQVEHIIGELPKERQQAIAAAAGNRYAQARQDYDEAERNLTPAQRKEREAAASSTREFAGKILAPMTVMSIRDHLDQAREDLSELIADRSLTSELMEEIEKANEAWQAELEVALALAGRKED